MSLWIDLEQVVEKKKEDIGQQILSRGTRAVNEMRNSAVTVLTNTSPAPPGSPPGVRTGNLRRNWSLMVSGDGSGAGVHMELTIQSNMEYAVYQEFGTSKMAARPFRQRIADDSAPKVTAIFAEPYS